MTTADSFRVLGLLGGIGAGKSLVATALESLGCVRIDADRVGHELLRTEPVRAAIRARWGDGVFSADGEVDRARLGPIVFADESQLRELEAIVHPRMRAEFERCIALARREGAAAGVVLDAAVMLEAGWDTLCDAMIFVDSPRAMRLARVATERNWDAAELDAREKRQISLDIKAESCCYRLDNSSTPSHLTPQVASLFRTIFS